MNAAEIALITVSGAYAVAVIVTEIANNLPAIKRALRL
jgi:hypothetical protein